MKNSYQNTAVGRIYRVGYDWLFDNAKRKEVSATVLGDRREPNVKLTLFTGFDSSWQGMNAVSPSIEENENFIEKLFPLVPIKSKEQMARHYLFGHHRDVARHEDLRWCDSLEVVVEEAAMHLCNYFGIPTHYILHDGFAVFFDIEFMEFLYIVDTTHMVVLGSLIYREPSKLLFCKVRKDLESTYEKSSNTDGKNNKD